MIVSECAAEISNFGVDLSDFVMTHSVTDVGELADMLKGVVAPISAHFFHTADHETEAVEVLRSVVSIWNVLINYLLEESINELTVVDFFLELIVSLFRALFGSPSSEGMKLVVTRVNDFNVALLLWSGDMLVNVIGLVDHIHDEIIRVRLKRALEVTNRFTQEGLVSKDLNGAHVGLCLHISLLRAESLRCNISSLSVEHPVDGEEIGEAGVEVYLVDYSLRTTVSSVGGLSSI